MALTIHNTAAFTTYNSKASDTLSKPMERLSTVSRINSDKDSAVSLEIASRLRPKVADLNIIVRDQNDAISKAQTARGALSNVTQILQRMKDLTLMQEHGNPSLEDKKSIAVEYNQMADEIDRIGKNTNFNGVKLLDGSGSITFQVGANSSDTIKISVGNMSASGLGLSKISGDGSDFSTVGSQVMAAIVTVNAQLSTMQNALGDKPEATHEATTETGARDRLQDMDLASETTELTKQHVLQQASNAIMTQANQLPNAVLGLLK